MWIRTYKGTIANLNNVNLIKLEEAINGDWLVVAVFVYKGVQIIDKFANRKKALSAMSNLQKYKFEF